MSTNDRFWIIVLLVVFAVCAVFLMWRTIEEDRRKEENRHRIQQKYNGL